jgi:hypothetical protein
MWVKHQAVLAMALRPGSFELGLCRSEMIRLTYDAGEISLVPRYFEKWFRTDDLHYLSVGISDAALTAAADGTSGEVELRRADNLSDHRLMIVQTKQAFGASWICARTLLPAGFPFRPTRTLTQPELAVPNTRFFRAAFPAATRTGAGWCVSGHETSLFPRNSGFSDSASSASQCTSRLAPICVSMNLA